MLYTQCRGANDRGMKVFPRTILAAAGLALLPFAPALAAAPSAPIPRGNPGLWVSTNDYPAEALKELRGGVTEFILAIDPQGKVSGCTIATSSGSGDLDAATCALITQRAVFVPAQDTKGKAVQGTYRNRVRWTIPPTAPSHPLILMRCGADDDLRLQCET